VIPRKLTEITIDWLDGALHANGFLRDNSVVSLNLEAAGVGTGNLSHIGRLTVSYQRSDPSLPQTMIAKIPTTFESARAIGLQLGSYERETRFYLEVAPLTPIRTPALIYGGVDSQNERWILLLEDCSCYTPIDQVKGLDLELSRLIAIKAADFHTRWWNAENLFSFAWMPKPRGSRVKSTIDILRKNLDICAKSDEFKNILPKGGWEACVKVYERAPQLIDSVSDENLTIIHSDFRSDNMFLDKNKPDDPLVVFDWQMVQVSRGIFDLAYLFGASMTVDLRRKIEKDMVRLYHERLLQNGISGYSFDECWTDYLKGWLMYTYVLAMAYASLDNSNQRAAELLRRALDRWFSAIVDNDAVKVLK